MGDEGNDTVSDEEVEDIESKLEDMFDIPGTGCPAEE